MVEGKSHGGTSLLRHHQSIAALLMFSKIQKSRHLIKSNTFPMLIVSPTDVIILMYQPQTDTLVITQVLPWEKVAYFFVWAVLHHSIFPINMPEAVECGYAKATEDFSFGDYWYLANKTVLQGNNSQAIPKFACTYRFVQDRTKWEVVIMHVSTETSVTRVRIKRTVLGLHDVIADSKKVVLFKYECYAA